MDDPNLDLDIYEEEVATIPGPSDWDLDSPVGYELTDTKCFKTPSGVQKTATIAREQLPMPDILADDVLDGSSAEDFPVVCSEDVPSTSNAMEYRQPVPLRRMSIRIGKKTLKFKVINASEAPEGPDNYEPTWLSNPTPVKEPKSLAGLYHCANCKTYFGNKEVWQRHMTEVHGDPRPFRCFNCGMRFANKSSMTLHLKDHALLRPVYACDYCPRLFSKIENRNMHHKMHVVRFTCTECGRFFRSRDMLENHVNTLNCGTNYQEELLPNGLTARFRCSFCPQKFHFKKDMVVHERIHTGEKPFTCGYCGRGFAQSQALTVHIRTHTQELPYKCDTCTKKFRDNSALRKHELSAHTAGPITRPIFRISTNQATKIGQKQLHPPTSPEPCLYPNQ